MDIAKIKTENYSQVVENLGTLERYLECPICLEILKDTHVVPSCQHRFCGKCIQESLRKCNNECPSCRVHVSTRRSLRTDEVFESLVHSLCLILNPTSENESEGNIDYSSTLESLRSLRWHFMCPLCNQTLKKAHISSECLHRFCQGCVEAHDSKNQCPCCGSLSSSKTSFNIDKQFDEIVVAVEKTIESLLEAGFGAEQESLPDRVESSGALIAEPDGNQNLDADRDGEGVADETKDLAIRGPIEKYTASMSKDKKPPEILSENLSEHQYSGYAKGKNKKTVKFAETTEDKLLKAKYSRGTYFKDSEDRFGRVVGFDGQVYQIFYPKDGDCGVLKETDFDHVKIIQRHKRPSLSYKSPKDNVPSCPNCKRLFSSNPKDISSGSLPIQSQKCAHVICFDCVQSSRASTGKNNKKLRVTVDCPICKKSQSFNGKDPTVCLAMCQVVSLYNTMKLRREQGSNPSSSSRADRKRYKNEIREDKKRRRASSSERSKKSEDLKKNSIGSMPCTSCRKHKTLDKFSSKQLKNGIGGAHKVLCRRCEEKGKVQGRWGSGYEKYSTTISMVREGKKKKKPKFLTTVIPWRNGTALKLNNILPPDLVINGYSREAFGRLSNEDLEQEAAWKKIKLWCTGADEIQKFIGFLQESKKSAYGTFLLADGTDGFFVIPFDQSTPTEVFICKYILGLGITGSKANKKDPGSSEAFEGGDGNATLRKLLAAEYKTSQSLDEVRQGTVSAKKIIQGPEAPKAHNGPSDWFRERIIIREPSDDEVSKSEKEILAPGEISL